MITIKKISSCKYKDTVSEEYHISGLQNGFGNTIGNSLRRIIIGYTPGIAVFGINIDCFKHEFDHNNDILEDANQIVDRFRNVIIVYDANFQDDQVLEVEIKLQGPKEVKIGDLLLPNGLKTINNSFVLFNIVKDVEITLKLFINKGFGFKTCTENSNKCNTYAGLLGVTSVYSNINRVTFRLLDKNTGLLDDDEIIITVEHVNIYALGFTLMNALKKLSDVTQQTLDAYNQYSSSIINSERLRIHILNHIESRYGNEVVNFFSKLDFINYDEFYNLISKLTYKKCKLTKEQFTELCNFIKGNLTENETQDKK